MLYISAGPDDIGRLVEQMRKAGIDQPIFGGDGYDTPLLVETAGVAAHDTYFTTHAFLDPSQAPPVVQQFIADYETEYGVPPETAFAALAYDAVMLIASAIERADSAKQKDIAGALERTGDFPGVTGSINFAPAVHIPDKEVTIVHIVGDERTLAAIIQRRTGQRLSEYLRPRLLDPLGIGDVGWQCWPAGRELGFSGLFARTEDVAKLGQLYLQRGRWGKDHLFPETYVEVATYPQISTSAMENPDWRQGYGYQFWMARHGYRGDGAFGQFSLVLPEQDAVVAMTGGTEATQTVLDHVWDHLLPGLGSASPDETALPELEERLCRLQLPARRTQPSPVRWEDWTAAPFPVTSARDPSSRTTIASVAVARADDRLEVTISERDNTMSFAVANGEWLVSEPRDVHGDVVPVAGSGGWLDEQTFLAVGFDLVVEELEMPAQVRADDVRL